MGNANDLKRFLVAQKNPLSGYEIALSEIRKGKKRSCWMWYIFPQLEFQGCSETSKYYAIRGIAEAKEYLRHRVLGKRLTEIAKALLELETDDPEEVFGPIDSMKLQSSMTLFRLAGPRHPEFKEVLYKFYDGDMDEKTIEILRGGMQNG